MQSTVKKKATHSATGSHTFYKIDLPTSTENQCRDRYATYSRLRVDSRTTNSGRYFAMGGADFALFQHAR